MKLKFDHEPVLLREVVDQLDPKKGDYVIDCTLGAGGHTFELIERIKTDGKLLAIDADIQAIKIAKEKLKSFVKGGESNQIIFHHGNFKDLKEIAEVHGFLGKTACILMDLGVSSMQLDNLERGFSFKSKDLLDMRFDKDNQSLTADEIVNEWSANDLEKIFKKYGEEKFAKKIAKSIVAYRQGKKIEQAKELAELVEMSIPKKFQTQKIHPATRVFQALRIEVNNELNILKETLISSLDVLKPGGKIAVISFHSLEDRIVKQAFKEFAAGCICPLEFPICVCDNKPKLKIITKRPLTADKDEIERNPRSRSAKLRVAQTLNK